MHKTSFEETVRDVLRKSNCRPIQVTYDTDREQLFVKYINQKGRLARKMVTMMDFSASRVYSFKSTEEIIREKLFE
jgi:hypothetical protein